MRFTLSLFSLVFTTIALVSAAPASLDERLVKCE
jgi:hypothetical protein